MPPENRCGHQKSPALAGLSLGAGATGLEPATSGVTGRRSNRLSYAPVRDDSMAAPRDRLIWGFRGYHRAMYIGIGTLILIIILVIVLL